MSSKARRRPSSRRPRLVASGHLHLYRMMRRGRVSFAWAPPLSFVVHPAEQPGLPGERVCGALLHRLRDDNAETLLLASAGIETAWHDAVWAETYPRPSAMAAD